MFEDLTAHLRHFGAPAESIRSLTGQPTPEHVRYLDLMTQPSQRPTAVVEVGTEPLAYVTPPLPAISSLHRSLVLRADAPYLLVIHPGKLEVFSLALASKPHSVTVAIADSAAGATFERLYHGSFQDVSYKPHAVAERLFELVDNTIGEIIALGVGPDDAVAMTCRAMFGRFLLDRKIITESDCKGFLGTRASSEDLFQGPTKMFATYEWMNATFNGELLPLSFAPTLKNLRNLPEAIFKLLSRIVRCEESSQLTFEWESINFAHVPVGLLSQVYERQAERLDKERRKKTGVYYTPRRIVEIIVAEAFAQIREDPNTDPSAVKVLDPAVGGGVFLVAAFREIIAEKWRKWGRRPNTEEIREVLYTQLHGFDISESALRLSALSLYLSALELDPDPHPPGKLTFKKKLKGLTLHDVSTGELEIGSLRPLPEHRSKYDLVIGNPPWTAVPIAVMKRIQAESANLVPDESIVFPDTNPDVPFLWAAKYWSVDSGHIALAMHARILFAQSGTQRLAREKIFSSIETIGILNGAEFRKVEEIWPGNDAQFCVFFGRNRAPAEKHQFYFISPQIDSLLNQQGRMRIDSRSAQPVAVQTIKTVPTLLKTLYRGTALDVGILRHVSQAYATITVDDYWKEIDKGFDIPSLGRSLGQGYKIGKEKKRKRDATPFWDLPDISSDPFRAIVLDSSEVSKFGVRKLRKLERTRKTALYHGPIVLVRKVVPIEARFISISWESVFFSESIYGLSTARHSRKKTLAKYMFLLLNSDVFLWFALVTSGEYGVEREAIQARDLYDFRIRPLEDLDEKLVSKISQHFRAAAKSTEDRARETCNAFAQEVYGFDEWQMRTIKDTLNTRRPDPRVIADGQSAPRSAEIYEFTTILSDGIAHLLGVNLSIKPLPMNDRAWISLQLSTGVPDDKPGEPRFAEANQVGASAIFDFQEKCVVISLLNQRRYWTSSQARLLVLDLVREYADLLKRMP